MINRTPIELARHALRLKFVDKMTWTDISQKLGMSVGKIRRRCRNYGQLMTRLLAMTDKEIRKIIKDHPTYQERFGVKGHQ